MKLMPARGKPDYILKTTPAALVDWATTQFAKKQTRTAQALRALSSGSAGSVLQARNALGAIVAADVRFWQKFEADPSAALCLVAVDRALGGPSLPDVDALVDAAFTDHGGDAVALAGKLLDRLEEFSEVLWRIHNAVRLTQNEERFLRRAAEDAEFEMHDSFVTSCIVAADYLGEDLTEDDPQLPDLAFYAWLMQAFPTALPTLEAGARVRLLRALTDPADGADMKEVETYMRWVIEGACVDALDRQVVRTRHVPLLRAFVAEAPHGFGERARVLLEQLETCGLYRWGPAGRA